MLPQNCFRLHFFHAYKLIARGWIHAETYLEHGFAAIPNDVQGFFTTRFGKLVLVWSFKIPID